METRTLVYLRFDLRAYRCKSGGRRGCDISSGGGSAVTQLKKCREIPEIMSKQITDRAATSRAELSGAAASSPAAAAGCWLLAAGYSNVSPQPEPRFQSLESPSLVTGGKGMSDMFGKITQFIVTDPFFGAVGVCEK